MYALLGIHVDVRQTRKQATKSIGFKVMVTLAWEARETGSNGQPSSRTYVRIKGS
jgi:hypothetical protein